MPLYFVRVGRLRKGPFTRARLIESLQNGSLPDTSEIEDAENGEIVLKEEVLAGDGRRGHGAIYPIPQGELSQTERRLEIAEREIWRLQHGNADAQEANTRLLHTILALVFCGPVGLLLLLSDSRRPPNWTAVWIVLGLAIAAVTVLIIKYGNWR